MATRNVVLSQHQHELVESLVTSGRYQNASEVLRAGLRLLERQEAEDTARIAALRDAVDTGWADLAAGRCVDLADEKLDDFIARLGTQAAQPHTGRTWDSRRTPALIDERAVAARSEVQSKGVSWTMKMPSTGVSWHTEVQRSSSAAPPPPPQEIGSPSCAMAAEEPSPKYE